MHLVCVRSFLVPADQGKSVRQKRRQGVILFGSIALTGVKSDGELQA